MNTNRTFVGIDYSMTSPAITVYRGEPKDFTFDKCKIHFVAQTKAQVGVFENLTGYAMSIVVPDYVHEIERFRSLARWAVSCIPDDGSEIVSFIEGYSMGSKGNVFNIGENTAVLKNCLADRGIYPQIFAPTEVKQNAGKGNYDKNQMHRAFVQLTGTNLHNILCPKKANVGSPDGDIVDSFFVLRTGIQLY
jgi:hypothetical protein